MNFSAVLKILLVSLPVLSFAGGAMPLAAQEDFASEQEV